MSRLLVLAALACGFAASGFGDTKFRVLTYNIHHGEGRDGKVDLDRLAGVIKSAQADIVCLQEVDRNVPRSGKLDIPAELAKKLNMPAIFEPNLKLDGGDYGNAILTRLEVIRHENIRLPTPQGAEPRGCLRATVLIAGQPVEVFNTHLSLWPTQRKEQIAAILSHVGSEPTVMVGDWNETTDAPGVRMLMSQFRDTWNARESADRDMRYIAPRIDLILVSAQFSLLASGFVVTVDTTAASDHFPYWAELRLERVADGAERKGIYEPKDERINEALGDKRTIP
ncbi:MAG: endonuclease/exonuclease/phosphatase family protein [Candidatus Hydrogenedentes bacterium]|nr:endonuclease/exonuclease/phosphatase family protein [Candidatus Hydrogenedentota bacterium]